jgi:shikimate kinase
MEMQNEQAPTRVVLTGFMGAGKTSVGARFATAIGWAFVDLDEEIVRSQKASIASIFASVGEPAFRELERAALVQTLQRDNIVLALGGGTLELASSRTLLIGDPSILLVYLHAPLEVLLARCEEQRTSMPEAARRPVLEDRDALAERFLRRKPFYEAARWHIDTARGNSAEIVSELLLRWQRY